MYQASLGNLDPKDGEIKYYPLRRSSTIPACRMNFVGLRHDVDGKVVDQECPDRRRLSASISRRRSGERFQPLKHLANGKRNTIYQLISDIAEQRWVAEFMNGYSGA
jgi:hypothetical protein